ncbi:MAG: hypothetical protein J6T87_04865 [Bacteroidales bacterium]|nr:hypothetical protein [Bacteroidales bacterium]
MEKQPQPVFAKKQGEVSENEREKVYKELPRPQNGGGVIIWLSIFCAIFRILSFTLYRIFGSKDTKFLNDKAMNDDEKR